MQNLIKGRVPICIVCRYPIKYMLALNGLINTLLAFLLQSWDEGIAITAQKWADNCKIGHDERYKRYDYGKSTSNGEAYIHCSIFKRSTTCFAIYLHAYVAIVQPLVAVRYKR